MLYELKNIRKSSEKKISQAEAAREFNVPLGTYRNWEQCVNMPRDNKIIKRIADFYGVPMEALFGYDLVEPGSFSDFPENKDDKFEYVPVVYAAAAGAPQYPSEVEDHIPIPKEVMRRHPGAYLVKVDGTSMDRVLPNRSYALIDEKYKEIDNGRIYAIKINGDDMTIKRVKKLEHGYVLEPDSATDPTHEPIIIKESSDKFEEVSIVGKVVWYTLRIDEDFDA